jgi:hypothetical protein
LVNNLLHLDLCFLDPFTVWLANAYKVGSLTALSTRGSRDGGPEAA